MPNYYKKCIVPGCASFSRYWNKRYFSFPKNPDILEKWTQNLRINLKANELKDKYICSKHFLPQDMGSLRLKAGAVPSQFLGHSPTHTSVAREAALLRNCCFSHCSSNSKTHTMFPFPKNEKLCAIWCAITQVVKHKKTDCVCELHFKAQDIHKKRLKHGTIPTEYLSPPSSPVLEKGEESDEVQMDELEEYVDEEQCYSEEIYISDSPDECAEKEEYYVSRIKSLTDELKETKLALSKLQEATQKAQKPTRDIIPLSSTASNDAKEFASMIISDNEEFTEAQKSIIIQLNEISSESLYFMRKTLGFNLPDPETIRRWCTTS